MTAPVSIQPTRPPAKSVSASSALPLAERWARRYGVRLDEVEVDILRRSLYPHARLTAGWLAFVRPDFFDHERALIAAIIREHQLGDTEAELKGYRSHAAERGGWRQTLRLRISTRRLRRLLLEVFAASSREVASPIVSPPRSG